MRRRNFGARLDEMRPAHAVAYSALRLLGAALDGALGTLLLARHGQLPDDFGCQFRVVPLLMVDIMPSAHFEVPRSLGLYWEMIICNDCNDELCKRIGKCKNNGLEYL